MSSEIEQVNQRYIQEYLPAIILTIILVVVGFSGNTIAAIYFGWKASKSVVHYLVFALSVNDAVTNIVFVDTIAKFFFLVEYRSDAACKLTSFLRHWLIGNSLLLMIPIAIDRFRKICFLFSKQLTLTSARCSVIGLTVFSFLNSARNFVTINVLRINITTKLNSTKGFYCGYSEESDFKAVDGIFNYVDICLHASIICCVILLYSLTAKRIVQSKRNIEAHLKRNAVQSKNSNMDNSEEEINSTSKTVDFQLCRTQEKEGVLKPDQALFNTKEIAEKETNTSKQSRYKAIREKIVRVIKPTNEDLKTSKTTRAEIRVTVMVAVITAGSVLCFVPYYISVLLVTRNFSGDGPLMSTGNLVVSRSYMLNSLINPLIMVAFNKSFRDFVRSLLRCKC